MAKKIQPLSDTKIRNAKPQLKLYKLRDGNGLMICINPSGKKSWRMEYKRPADGKKDSMTLGEYPLISLSEAREKREEIRSLIEHGIDPKAQSIQNENVMTLNMLFEEWFPRWSDTVTERYALQVKRALRTNIFIDLGKKEISEIKPRNIVETLTNMENRGVLEYLKRTKGALKLMYEFAVERGYCEYNPVLNIGNKAFKKPEKNNFSALKPNQLRDLLSALSSSQMEQMTKACILVLLSTLCRPAEVTNMQWKEIDFNEGVWVIPAERMKARREHKVPLSTFTLNILNKLKPFTGSNQYVFCGAKPNLPINRETPRIALRRFKKMGLDTTSHGLRALGRTYLEESRKWDTEVMEAVLAHKEPNQTKAAYNRYDYLKEKKELLEWWGDEINQHIL